MKRINVLQQLQKEILSNTYLAGFDSAARDDCKALIEAIDPSSTLLEAQMYWFQNAIIDELEQHHGLWALPVITLLTFLKIYQEPVDA